MRIAIVKGYTRTMKNTSIRNIADGKEGDVFNILYRKGLGVTPYEAKVAHTELKDADDNTILKYVDI
jgi:hypothetical protein